MSQTKSWSIDDYQKALNKALLDKEALSALCYQLEAERNEAKAGYERLLSLGETEATVTPGFWGRVASRLTTRVKALEGALRDIRDNWDCEYVEGGGRVGHHPCRHCRADTALRENSENSAQTDSEGIVSGGEGEGA